MRGHRSPTPEGIIHVVRVVEVNDITIDAAAATAAAAMVTEDAFASVYSPEAQH